MKGAEEEYIHYADVWNNRQSTLKGEINEELVQARLEQVASITSERK